MTQILMLSEQFKKASNTAAPNSIVDNALIQIAITIENNKVMGLTLSVDPFIEFTTYQFKKIN